jgi:integrase
VRTITTSELGHWLHDLKLSPQTINDFRSRLAALFHYGEKRSYLERNPVASIDRIKVVDEAPEIFMPDQIQILLDKAPADLLPCLALSAFAGLRTAELLRLKWEAVDLQRGLINVAASKIQNRKTPADSNLSKPHRVAAVVLEKSFRTVIAGITSKSAWSGRPPDSQNGQITGSGIHLLPITLPSIRKLPSWLLRRAIQLHG